MTDDRLIEKQLEDFDRKMDSQQQEFKIFSECDICSSEICIGEDYYNFDGEIVCNNCIHEYVEEFRRIAEDEVFWIYKYVLSDECKKIKKTWKNLQKTIDK